MMISVHDLHFSYNKNQRLFESLQLELSEGHIYGLLGKNGTGKTTLFKLFMGALFPKKGNIDVLGHSSRSRHPQMLQRVYHLPEEYDLPAVSIKKFDRIYGVFYPHYDRDKFYHLLAEFEVPETGKLHTLSFGQKKKVLIAFSIATGVELLLLDEPTNGLDIPSKSQFRKVMAGNLGDSQTAIISTHQVRDLTNLIDSVIILEDGQIIFKHDLHEITEKIQFVSSMQAKDSDATLYSELIPGAYMHVLPNPEKIESEVDLEVLFNAVTQKTDQIQQLFK